MSATLSTRPRRRLVVPAPRTEPRETLVPCLPFFLRSTAPSLAPPPLLSFEGSSFIEDFLAVAEDSARLPKLLAWRDWAEPPAGVLDAAGAPRYPTSLRRATPIAIEPESGVAADGVPQGDPPWVRKLYLPLHGRFTLVAFDLVCQRAGWPPVDRARVLGAGAVVRRLRPDPAALRWEDWISADGKRGVWLELARPVEEMDPEALPPGAFAGREVALRTRLSLAAAAPLPTALDSVKLALLPPDAAGGMAARHCTAYGFVPVFSAAEQATELTGTDPAVLAAELRARARAAVQAVATSAPALRGRTAGALAMLLDRTVLPPAPSAAEVAAAWTAVGSYVSPQFPAVTGTSAETAAALDTVLRALLVRGWEVLSPATTDAGVAGGAALDTPVAWLARAEAALRSEAQGTDGAGLIGSAWLAQNYVSNTAFWRRLALQRLHALAQAIRQGMPVPAPQPGTPAPLDGTDGTLLLACAVLRLRLLRMGLLAALRRRMFNDAGADSLIAVRNGVPASTAGTLGQEIEAALGLEQWRGTPDAPPWPPLVDDAPMGSGDHNAAQAHRAALVLEEAHADAEAAAAAAGSAFEQEQEDRLLARADALGARLGLPGTPRQRMDGLRAWGLELREQPARGLFALPGPAPDSTALQAAAGSVAARYAPPLSLTEARGHAQVPRLRYDHDSLYAVWCWVRVAGRDPCEKAQVIWTPATEPFSIAEPSDVLGARPATVQLPDIPRLIRDIPRIAKARARPFAAFAAPPDSSYITGDEPQDTQRAWGIGWICSFGIPVLTICAFILFSIIFSILIVLPGFAWMLFLKFCLPVPKRSS